MKVGDKVRFLNDVGGGVIVGFQNNDIVIVRDEDGFDMPTLVREVVVIETNELNFARPSAPAPREADNRFRSAQPDTFVHSFDDDEDEKPITFKPRPLERRGADVLNLFFGFVPVNAKELSNTAFEAYLVNDSNYYVRFLIFNRQGNACTLRHEGLIEPNTKLFLEEFRRDVLPELENLTVQTLAYKDGKSFLPKPAMSIPLRIDGTRFYKLHTFSESDFFEEPAFMVDILRDDHPGRTAVFVDADRLQEAMSGKTPAERPLRQPARHKEAEKKSNLLEIDLHAEELLDSTAGMQPKDILDFQMQKFRDTMQAHLKEKGRKIVFIHGKGDGTLRAALLKELRSRYKQCAVQDASFREYGFGATMVTIR